ncbi:MAG: secondary thiamine-phosphate synthase enzyme YjbQ [Fervidobacterium sp.]|uniref:secondary thiamine-phosphate synthase enzyme YjbQ n=1 Tax=Fervidobacterium sp. TaxID=1871331 RepID=UPI00404B7A3B
MLKKLSVRTSKRVEFLEITGEVRKFIGESGIREGIVVIYVPHTTCGVTVNEHADPSVVSDMTKHLGKLVPEDAGYSHIEGNSDAHIKTSIIGSSLTLIINNGSLMLGTWQGVFLCEFDGPRTREIYLKIIAG